MRYRKHDRVTLLRTVVINSISGCEVKLLLTSSPALRISIIRSRYTYTHPREPFAQDTGNFESRRRSSIVVAGSWRKRSTLIAILYQFMRIIVKGRARDAPSAAKKMEQPRTRGWNHNSHPSLFHPRCFKDFAYVKQKVPLDIRFVIEDESWEIRI